MIQDVVTFATLFLGLVVGPHEVELLVRQDVAAVEIRLNGEAIAEVVGAPWRAICDLGDELEPRRLEAVAYSASGEELGSAQQWLNLPHPPADVQLLLDLSPETGKLIAKVRWNSVEREDPISVNVSFDGVEIPTTDPRAIELPKHDPEQLHYLRIEVQFSEFIVSIVERTFGGSFTDTVSSELTAVPLRLDKGSKAPSRSGWLQGRGEPLEVVDVVSGPAELVFVRDQSAQVAIDEMARRSSGSYRWVAPLNRGYAVRFLRPVAEQRSRPAVDLHLFAPRSLSVASGGLLWLLTHVRDPRVPDPLQRLSDAVAVAGVNISAGGHRRAVVLLLGPEAADNSHHSQANVRRYLEQLRVPLVVWSTEGEVDTPWGPAANVSTMAKLERETRRVVKLLEAQRIAWVHGVFQPPEVSLGPSTVGIHLAGS